MRGRQVTQNWLYCLLVGVLGLYASTYQTLVDRLAARFGLGEQMIGILLSVYAAGSSVAYWFPECSLTPWESAAWCCARVW